MIPFEAVYGRPPPSVLEYIQGSGNMETVDNWLARRETIIQQLRANITKAQARMRQFANKHRLDKAFEIGDSVYIRLQPYRQSSVRMQHTNKLAKRFYGPLEVLAKIGSVAYRLKFLEHARIHDVFHVSLLRKCMDPSCAEVWSFPDHFVGGQPVLRPIEVLKFRKIKTRWGWDTQLLIRWDTHQPSEAT
ncbi:unnamed protein product [Rhodiola kirilowii]